MVVLPYRFNRKSYWRTLFNSHKGKSLMLMNVIYLNKTQKQNKKRFFRFPLRFQLLNSLRV